MKAFVLMFFFVSSVAVGPDLSQIREVYPKASDSKEITDQLFEVLTSIGKEDHKVLVAYKGAVSTLKAKYAKEAKVKRGYFKTGADLIEYALQAQPNNIEIRCIRLGVQENSPKVVKYKDNIEEDKQFIIDNFKAISSQEVREFVKNFALQSSIFSDSEKQLF